MNANVGRLMAEQDLREITVQLARHGGEASENIRKHLEIEMGDVGKVAPAGKDTARDQAGFDELKTMAALM